VAASEVAASFFQTVYQVVTAGLGGIGLIAFFQRWIVPGSTLEDMRKEREEWKALYDKEREAHQATRDAFAAASARSEAGVEAARGYAALMRALRDDVGRPPPGTKDPGND
jgi:hypothetical protein